MGAAREAATQSMERTEAGDRDGWLALFAEDAVVEDPVGPSMFDPEGKGHRGIEAVTAFYDNVISSSEKIEFTIRDSYECGSEVANVGQIRITLPGGQVGTVPIVNIYKVDEAGKLLSLRSFWEADKLSFDAG
ncbi:MAG TPA: nuclear transport factor 2 family protein [Acidimicrobiales bacterium]|nr:nuclear transport factor 2 family protein [Acidimicrobiales bacterium]